MTYRLPPYFENLGKRTVRSSKLYFLDSALACSLTRQPSAEAALAGAAGGALFEGWIVAETVKAMTQLGQRPDLFFWRSHDGLVVDLLVPIDGKLLPVEIKLTASPTARHAYPLTQFVDLAGDKAKRQGLLICRVDRVRRLPHGHLALPWHEYSTWITERLSR